MERNPFNRVLPISLSLLQRSDHWGRWPTEEIFYLLKEIEHRLSELKITKTPVV